MFAQFVKEPENTGNQKIDTDIDLHKVFTLSVELHQIASRGRRTQKGGSGRQGHQGGNQREVSQAM